MRTFHTSAVLSCDPAMSVHVRRLIAASFGVDIRRRERFLADLLAASVPVAA